MTLIITRLVPSGIAMAADSTVTHDEPQTGRVWAVPSSTRKLHVVPDLLAGVASWGRGQINGTDTEDWIQAFIDRHKGSPSIGVFAARLASELNQAFGTRLTGVPSIGFQVAGLERNAEGLEPTFFHVHDGPSEMCEEKNVDPKLVNANHDCPPEYLMKLYAEGKFQVMRNGDFASYAMVSAALRAALDVLAASGLQVPKSMAVHAVSDFNVFEIRLMSELYSMSSLIPGIGGRIDWLTIDCSGRMNTGSQM